ncbi:MAG: hypothetical protein ACIARQ_02250 [Phycisphaerales bacterium JB061]
MNRRRKNFLAISLLLLIFINLFTLLLNFGARIKGHSHHKMAAAQGVIDELTTRDMIEMPDDKDEAWSLIWAAFVDPIAPHIDPFSDLAWYPPLINASVLGFVLALLVWPKGDSSTTSVGK